MPRTDCSMNDDNISKTSCDAPTAALLGPLLQRVQDGRPLALVSPWRDDRSPLENLVFGDGLAQMASALGFSYCRVMGHTPSAGDLDQLYAVFADDAQALHLFARHMAESMGQPSVWLFGDGIDALVEAGKTVSAEPFTPENATARFFAVRGEPFVLTHPVSGIEGSSMVGGFTGSLRSERIQAAFARLCAGEPVNLLTEFRKAPDPLTDMKQEYRYARLEAQGERYFGSRAAFMAAWGEQTNSYWMSLSLYNPVEAWLVDGFTERYGFSI